MRNGLMISDGPDYFIVNMVNGPDSFGICIYSREDADRLIALLQAVRDKLPEIHPKKAAKNA